MFNISKIKENIYLQYIQCHSYTVAIALSFNVIWRVPRDCFRYGCISYMMAYSVCFVLVALPITLLHLVLGRLSQQDVIALWRSVPFFRGLGYLRLLANFLMTVYTNLYIVLTCAYFLHSTYKGIPFEECTFNVTSVAESYLNASECLNFTFMSPVTQKPEYYIALSLISGAIWILFPFIMDKPVEITKRVFQISSVLIIVSGITVLSGVGRWKNLQFVTNKEHWSLLSEPFIWNAALTQVILTCQLGGGYLITISEEFYSNTNVYWTTIVFVTICLICNWSSSLFWYIISPYKDKDTSLVTVVVESYKISEDFNGTVFSLFTFAVIIISGVVTVYTIQYPIYSYMKRQSISWSVKFVMTLIGIVSSLICLAGGEYVLELIEGVAVPIIVMLILALELLVLLTIYGYNNVIKDVEFICEMRISKYWQAGWMLSPILILSLNTWWIYELNRKEDEYWTSTTVICTASVCFVAILLFAVHAVVKQDHFDFMSKVRLSFKPKRNWGPQDPLAYCTWYDQKHNSERNVTVPMTHIMNEPYIETRFKINEKYDNNKNRRSNSDTVICDLKRERKDIENQIWSKRNLSI